MGRNDTDGMTGAYESLEMGVCVVGFSLLFSFSFFCLSRNLCGSGGDFIPLSCLLHRLLSFFSVCLFFTVIMNVLSISFPLSYLCLALLLSLSSILPSRLAAETSPIRSSLRHQVSLSHILLVSVFLPLLFLLGFPDISRFHISPNL